MLHSARFFGLAAFVVALSSLTFACGDDDPSTSGSNNEGGSGNTVNTGGTGDGGTGTGNTGNTGGMGQGGMGAQGGMGGMSQGGMGGSGISMACEMCAQTNCPTEYATCQGEPGCQEIIECAFSSMCTGIDCLGPCGTVISMNGGVAGPAASAAIALAQCAQGPCLNDCM